MYIDLIYRIGYLKKLYEIYILGAKMPTLLLRKIYLYGCMFAIVSC